jgi:hypothetical protein
MRQYFLHYITSPVMLCLSSSMSHHFLLLNHDFTTSSAPFLNFQFVDPFLDAGNISSGTSLDRDKGQRQGPRARPQIESFDDSDGENDGNDFDDDDDEDGDDDSHEEAPRSAGRGVASSYPASSIRATPHRTPNTGSNSGTESRASEASHVTLNACRSR